MPSVSSAAEPVLHSERVFSELVSLAWPIAVSVLSYSVMTLVDTYFVTRLGAAAVGGVGLGGLAVFTLLCFVFGLLRAVKVLVAQASGAAHRHEAQAYLGAGLWVAGGFAIAFSLLALPLLAVLPRLAASPAVGGLAHAYLLVRVFGILPMLGSSALREARHGLGDTRSPMYVAILVNVLHIPLNYLLIFGFGWGVTGAGVSTVCVQTLELVLLALVQRPHGFGLGLASRRHAREILRIGAATGLEFFLGVSAFSALVAIIARMSEADLAAHQIGIQLIHFAFLPVVAVGEAASVLSGRAVGANRDDLVPVVARRALALAFSYAAFCAALFALFPALLLASFATDPRVFEISVQLLRVAALFQLFDALAIVLRSVLRGTGDVRVLATQSIASAWVLIPPLTWWFGVHEGLGAVGGWLALTADILFGATFVTLRTIRGGWRPAALRARERMSAHHAQLVIEA